MEDQGKGTWCGIKLEDMTREELYGVVASIDNLRSVDREQHKADLELLREPPLKKPWIVSVLLALGF